MSRFPVSSGWKVTLETPDDLFSYQLYKIIKMEKLTVIGCGTMGHSIALSAAWKGIPVKMYGVSRADTERGKMNIAGKIERLSQNGLLKEGEPEQIKHRIKTTTSIDAAVGGSSFIIETIPENIDLKKRLFRNLDSICGRDVILASNTSGLSPSMLASVTAFPERVVVTHFWNPAHLIPLVEVVRGKMTADDTVKRTMELLRMMKKKPIEVKKEIPGFVANRLQFALFREAQFLLEKGIASKEDIDAATIYSIGRRLSVTGPLVSADMGGLDVFASISDYLFGELCKADHCLPTLKELVKNNKLGCKTGEGYYVWDPSFSEKMNNKREIELIRFLQQYDEPSR